MNRVKEDGVAVRVSMGERLLEFDRLGLLTERLRPLSWLDHDASNMSKSAKAFGLPMR